MVTSQHVQLASSCIERFLRCPPPIFSISGNGVALPSASWLALPSGLSALAVLAGRFLPFLTGVSVSYFALSSSYSPRGTKENIGSTLTRSQRRAKKSTNEERQCSPSMVEVS